MRHKNSEGILCPHTHGETNILIVGAGGIGSIVAVCLAKMGMTNITVVDFDTVEDHNLQSQFYREQDIGKFKVDALQEIVLEQSGVEINIINDKFHPDHVRGRDVVFTLVDNNDVRKEIVDACLGIEHIIDCRMGGIFYEICNFSSMERNEYFKDFRFPQEEATEVVCSMKSSCFNCFNVASMACAVLRGRLVGNDVPTKITLDTDMFYYQSSY